MTKGEFNGSIECKERLLCMLCFEVPLELRRRRHDVGIHDITQSLSLLLPVVVHLRALVQSFLEV